MCLLEEAHDAIADAETSKKKGKLKRSASEEVQEKEVANNKTKKTEIGAN